MCIITIAQVYFKSTFNLSGMEGSSRPEANPYGAPVAPEEAPEAITQAVASLPPEQMFELMKQMKVVYFLYFKAMQ